MERALKVVAFFDGGVRKVLDHDTDAPLGFIGAGAAVVYQGVEELGAHAKFLAGSDLTNNMAEYEGLLLGLETARDIGAADVEVYGDSELIVRQVRGEYRVRKEHLRPFYARAIELSQLFERFVIRETPRGKKGKRRDNNARADELANLCMDRQQHIWETKAYGEIPLRLTTPPS